VRWCGHDGRSERPLHSAGSGGHSVTLAPIVLLCFTAQRTEICVMNVSSAGMSALHVTCVTGKGARNDRPLLVTGHVILTPSTLNEIF